MRYYTKYNTMQSTVVDFNSSSRALSSYAQRLNRVKSALVGDSSLSSIRSNLGSRANTLSTMATTTTDIGKCIENIRNGYINGEQKAFQVLSISNPQTIGGKRSFVNFSFKDSFRFLSRWITPLSPLLPSFIVLGPAVVVSSWPLVNWGFLAPIVDWFKNPFGRTKSKWGEAELKLESTPEHKPEKESKLKPEPYKRGNPPGTFTREEREADIKMRDEAHVLLGSYKKKWVAANTDARKQTLLNSFLSDLQGVNGTSANPDIRFTETGKIAWYDTEERTIVINMRTFKSDELLNSLMHEARHAYQAEAFGYYGPSNHLVSEERKQAWKQSFSSKDFSIACADAHWYARGL